jgi:hypothetical protein
VPSLLLHARDPYWSPDKFTALIQPLHDLGLISTPCGEGQNSTYRAGENFPGLVMFLGCSPQVLLDPQSAADGQPVCSVHFRIYPEVTFLSAAKRPAARCRQCRTPVKDEQHTGLTMRFTCEQCGEVSEANDLDWRQAAGFGCCFVEIAGIYPQEAVPSDKLLDSLASCSGGSWQHFFV